MPGYKSAGWLRSVPFKLNEVFVQLPNTPYGSYLIENNIFIQKGKFNMFTHNS